MEKRELTKFGLALAVVICVLWLIVRPDLAWSWLGGSVALVVVVALTVPRALLPIHWLLSKIGHAMSRIITPLLLGLLYFVIMTPLGLSLRLFGHDPMRRRPDTDQQSYRDPSTAIEPDDFKKPY